MAGYKGYSMSNNAVDAYNSGEKPLSKWTKSDILDEIKSIDPSKYEIAKKLPVKALRDNLLLQSSWHHTSEYYNKTDFYSVNPNAVERLTETAINDWKPAKEEKTPVERYKGKIEYLEWTGTRNHPKANTKILEDVYIEEKGRFYIVYDKQGNELLRKKIGSNGTRVINYQALKEQEKRNKELAKQQKQRRSEIRKNSSAKAWEVYKQLENHHDTSMSGTIYPWGRKTPHMYYDMKHVWHNQGEVRLVPNDHNGYELEVFSGTDFVPYTKLKTTMPKTSSGKLPSQNMLSRMSR